MADKYITLLQEKFPFLSLYEYGGEEFLGIIQNYGKNIVSVYNFNKITDQQLKRRFIELGEIWWTESNRKICINLFFKQDFDVFAPFMVNYVSKEFRLLNGHIVSLHSLNAKRVKRKRVQMVVKPK